MSRRADRLFRLVQLLRSRQLITAERIAEELGVSKRTVYRDVRDLMDSGVPVRGEAGVGYALQRGYELPPLTFTAGEVEALVLGARMIQSWGDPELADAARSAMTRIEAVLPPPLRSVLLQTALFAPRGPWMRARSEGLAEVRQGIAQRRKLRFAYTNRQGDSSERTVRPLGLYFWGSSWTMAAWCELRVAYRNFRPDRMHGLLVLDESWPESDGVTIEAYGEAMAEHDGHEKGWSGFR